MSPFPSPVITVHDIGTENPPASDLEDHGSQSSELEALAPNNAESMDKPHPPLTPASETSSNHSHQEFHSASEILKP